LKEESHGNYTIIEVKSGWATWFVLCSSNWAVRL
jgi:hypothetical protein